MDGWMDEREGVVRLLVERLLRLNTGCSPSLNLFHLPPPSARLYFLPLPLFHALLPLFILLPPQLLLCFCLKIESRTLTNHYFNVSHQNMLLNVIKGSFYHLWMNSCKYRFIHCWSPVQQRFFQPQ